jgi:formamidopyrimidine-DNA glycosylase
MPELPEVETVMRGMSNALQNRIIQHATVHRHDLRWRIPASFSQTVSGCRITSFLRRGKYILVRLSGEVSILLHLGMSGKIVLDSESTPAPHEHVTFHMLEGDRVAYVDPRRFGALGLVETAAEEMHPLLRDMGPEPLGPQFTAATLLAACSGRRAPLKSMLLDQKIVAGLGNIYVAEALYRADLHPALPAEALTRPAAGKLVKAIRTVLREAVEAGGSSLRDYVRPEGDMGYFQHAWRVYGRAGEPCPRCPGPPGCMGVERLVQSGRSSFFCPRYQKNG